MPDRFGHIPARRDHNTDVRRGLAVIPLGGGLLLLTVAFGAAFTSVPLRAVVVVLAVGAFLTGWGVTGRRGGTS